MGVAHPRPWPKPALGRGGGEGEEEEEEPPLWLVQYASYDTARQEREDRTPKTVAEEETNGHIIEVIMQASLEATVTRGRSPPAHGDRATVPEGAARPKG